MYDCNWGRLPAEVLANLKSGSDEILKTNSEFVVMKKLLGIDMDESSLAELILWAIENKMEE